MVTFTGKIAGHPVRAEINGPHQVVGDSELVTAAAGLIRTGMVVQAGQPIGGGIASFADPRIAVATLAEVCDDSSWQVEGLDLGLPDGAVG